MVSKRPKFVFFMLLGPAVTTRTRTCGLLHMGAIQEVMQQAHISLEAESANELSQAVIIQKLLQCGGAHKPNAWDFGQGGELIERERY